MPTPLEESDAPLCFDVEAGPDAPDAEAGALRRRVHIRSLDGMQKEALVTTEAGATWRLASDEGPYLNGADAAPPPLAFLTVGMVSAVAESVATLAAERGLDLQLLRVVVDNYYAISGSALRGDMEGEASDPDVEVVVDADADDETVEALVADAVRRSPVHGLLAGASPSLFALTRNGEALDPDRVAACAPLADDPMAPFDRVDGEGRTQSPPVVRHTGRETEPLAEAGEGYTDEDAAGFSDEQDRIIHLRGTGTLDDDGGLRVVQELFSPRGSVFEFRSETADGPGRAPDAATYIAAGVGLCFMTQLGRYADIRGEDLASYGIVEEFGCSAGGADAPDEGWVDPVETHVVVETDADEAFAREALDMSEQTCYLHALCRTDLAPTVTVTRP